MAKDSPWPTPSIAQLPQFKRASKALFEATASQLAGTATKVASSKLPRKIRKPAATRRDIYSANHLAKWRANLRVRRNPDITDPAKRLVPNRADLQAIAMLRPTPDNINAASGNTIPTRMAFLGKLRPTKRTNGQKPNGPDFTTALGFSPRVHRLGE